MADFANRTVLITGGASGIGAASARRLAELGARIVVADVNVELGPSLVAELGSGHRFVEHDVADHDAWTRLMAELDDDGGVDVVFLNAGVLVRPPTVPILDDPLPWITEASFRKVVAVNLGGVAFGVMAAVPHLEGRHGASILLTASGAGIKPYPIDPLYAMTKHGVIGFGRSLAAPLAERGIAINVLCPSGIETGLTPPDLRDSPDYQRAPASHTAEAVVTILGSGRTGGVWFARRDEPVYELEIPAPA